MSQAIAASSDAIIKQGIMFTVLPSVCSFLPPHALCWVCEQLDK